MRTLVGLLALLAGCSLFLDGDSEVIDAAPPLPDAEPTPAQCDRIIHLADDFNGQMIDTNVWTLTGPAAITQDDVLEINTANNSGSISSDPLPLGELAADVVAVTFGDSFDATIGLETASGEIVAGQIGAAQNDWGLAQVDLDGNFSNVVDEPAIRSGTWRLRLSASEIIAESSAFVPNPTEEFAEVGRLPFTTLTPLVVRLTSAAQGNGRTVSFDNVVASGPPPSGWCAIDQLGFVPSRGDTAKLFTEVPGGGGSVTPDTGTLNAPSGAVAVLRSIARYDFNGSVLISIPEVTLENNSTAVIEFRRSSTQRFGVAIDKSDITYFVADGTPTPSPKVEQHSATAHQFLRITAAGGDLTFERSNDGFSFQLAHTAPLPFSATDVEIQLRATGTVGTATLQVNRIVGSR